MNISIIIPNYNGEILLEKNLPRVIEAVHNYKNGKAEIIISDDASIDRSLEIIEKVKQKFSTKSIRVISHEKNRGFSSNVNSGVESASGDIIILLNTDVAPENSFLENIVKHFNDQQVFAVGFTDKSVEGDDIVLRGRGIGRWHRGFLMHGRGELNRNNTLWANGGSSAFRKSIWVRLGGLYEVYNPFYWEDIDISYRALKSGYSVIFDPTIFVLHEHEKGTIRSHYSQFTIRRIGYRNGFYFVWLNITDIRYLLEHVLWIPYYFLKDFAYLLGFLSALMHIPNILLYGFKNKRLFIKQDKEVLSDFEK